MWFHHGIFLVSSLLVNNTGFCMSEPQATIDNTTTTNFTTEHEQGTTRVLKTDRNVSRRGQGRRTTTSVFTIGNGSESTANVSTADYNVSMEEDYERETTNVSIANNTVHTDGNSTHNETNSIALLRQDNLHSNSEEPHNISRKKGDTVSMGCELRSNPTNVNITWYKDGKRLDNSSRYIFGGLKQNFSLKIQLLAVSDTGIYYCGVNPSGDLSVHRFNITVADCKNGSYGVHCKQLCGYCKDGAFCDTDIGFCQQCEGNQILPLCWELDCPFLRYGARCERTCGNCANNMTCNLTNGYCSKCTVGWIPPLCSNKEEGNSPESSDQTMALSVGLGAPAIMGLIIAALQGIKCFLGGLAKNDEEEEEGQEEVPEGLQVLNPEMAGLQMMPLEPPPVVTEEEDDESSVHSLNSKSSDTSVASDEEQ